MSARLRNLNPYELHRYLVNVYCLDTKGSASSLKRDTSGDRTDLDIIRENHKFVWNEDDVADTWEKQLAKKYCDKLFKEYCICDLSRYKENKVAMRWRMEKEVVLGKGHFQCGNKVCNESDGLKSWEVNFNYMEEYESKNTLVKLRLCPECSELLNYRSKKREVKRLKKIQKKSKKAKKPEKGESENDEEELPKPATPEDPVDAATSTEAVAMESDEASLWKKGLQEDEEKTREDEFQEYLEDLLL